MMNLVESLERQLEPNPNVPELRPGDTVRVHARIVEGDRERVQVFQGMVIRIRRGGANASFTVRRIASHGIGVERTFLLHSPRLEKVEVLRSAHVRRAQLYYLRGRRGKAARLREKRMDR
jgi:large subunit ribosomal protein L19